MYFIHLVERLKAFLMPVADLPVRVALGAIFIAHGLDKMTDVFGSGGMPNTIQGFAMMGFEPATLWANVAASGELLGGILVLLGFGTRVGALLISATMLVAIFGVHFEGGFFAKNNGFEYPLMILGAASTLSMRGAGPLAIDALFRKRLRTMSEARESHTQIKD
jgi:putative oxidoreductase